MKPKEQKDILKKNEKKIFSQNGEDGIIQYLLKHCPSKHNRFVEIGCGRGDENCTRHLYKNLRWKGLLIDRYPLFGKAKKEVSSFDDVRFVCVEITPSNLNTVLCENLDSLFVDVVSIDVDSIEFWLLKALDAIKPRIIVVEYSAVFGFDSLTIPFIKSFYYKEYHRRGYYHGASLPALVKIGEKKGYSLVGCDSTGVNAFFIRSDLINKTIRKVSAKQAFYPSMRKKGNPVEIIQNLKSKGLKFVKV